MNTKNEITKLLASDGVVKDQFGYSVSISSDGNTAIVGVPYGNNEKGTDAGSVYIYTRGGSKWEKQAKIVASDGIGGEWFGRSVAISGDGNTVIVGSHRDDSRGSAYIFTRINGAWTEQCKLIASDGVSGDYYGVSVSISNDGDTAIVGAYIDDNEKGTNAGSAYVYTRTNGKWTEQSKLLASDGSSFDNFGASVSISGDGNTAIVGAFGDSGSRGSAYTYIRTNGTWSEQAKLLASDGSRNDLFGISVSISSDGNTVIIGASNDDRYKGSAYIYTRSNGTWSEQTKIVASDGSIVDQFGWSVSISSDGDTAIVGAYGDDNYKGSAYIFTRINDIWSQKSKLVVSDGVNSDYFGCLVSISGDGNTAIVGAYRDDRSRGSAYIFDLT